MFEYVKEYLKINDVEFKENLRLKNISPVRIGGNAKIVVYPDSEEKIVSLISFLTEVGCKYKTLGRMSNVLPPDEEYRGIIIRTDKLASVRFDNESVYVGAGVTIPRIARLAAVRGLGGFEELSGIPGTVAGSVIGNAGAFGREISDLFVSMKCFFSDRGIIEYVQSRDINFAYRQSDINKENCLVLSCEFKGKMSTSDEINSRLAYFADVRNKLQPTGIPSLGSTFKRPKEGLSAGALIDSCGLKGFTVGGASISKKHAGFILNIGDASSGDYIVVAETAQRSVYEKHGVKLEKEIEIID